MLEKRRAKQRLDQPQWLVAISEGPDGISMAFIEEHAGDALQVCSQLRQLARRFSTDENLLALTHGVPEIAAVFGDATGQGIGFAVVLHLGSRACRIQCDRELMGAQQRERLHAGCGRTRKAEQYGDRGRRRCPVQRAAHASAIRSAGGRASRNGVRCARSGSSRRS